MQATLAIDWDQIGLNAVTTVVTLPNIDGVQSPRTLASAEGPFQIPVNGGFVMLLQAGTTDTY